MASSSNNAVVATFSGPNQILYASSEEGLQDIVEFAIQIGADVNSKDYDDDYCHDTALLKAILNGHDQVVQTLLQNNVNVNMKNTYGEAPLPVAASYGYTRIVRLLLGNENTNVNIRAIGWTALMFACQNKHEEIVDMIVKKDPIVNFQSLQGDTALMLAIKSGNERICKLILEHTNPKLDVRNNKVETVFTLAAERGHEQIIQMLLEKEYKFNIIKSMMD